MTPSPGPTGSGGPHAFVENLERPRLSEADDHHLGRVLRVRSGDPLTVSDGRGAWRPCRYGPELVPTGPIKLVPAPTVAITIAFALVKGHKPELVVQKLTEVGVDLIRPFVAVRSITRWDVSKAAANTDRMRRVAREAAMQSRRCRLPTVFDPVPFVEVAQLPESVMAVRDGPPMGLTSGPILIGPEGGWAPEELDFGLPTVGLGPHVMRSETAAIAAGVLLAAARSGTLEP